MLQVWFAHRWQFSQYSLHLRFDRNRNELLVLIRKRQNRARISLRIKSLTTFPTILNGSSSGDEILGIN
jgi:hypothetical protein